MRHEFQPELISNIHNDGFCVHCGIEAKMVYDHQAKKWTVEWNVDGEWVKQMPPCADQIKHG